MKKLNRSPLLILLGLILLIPLLSHHAWGQKRSDRVRDNKTAPPSPVGPKRSNRTVPESERVKVITNIEFVKVAVRPNKGYLSVVAIPGAAVTLVSSSADQKKSPPIKETVKDEDGSLNLINLLPGNYKITIEHEDYLPYSNAIQVDPARPDTFVAFNKMISRYGAIRIGGAPANAKVLLDESSISASNLIRDNQSIVISKVPVGKHRLRVFKEGYVGFDKDVDVLPGEQALIPAQLDLARVTLSLTSEPGARVYVGSEEKASIPLDGQVAISLAPGLHSVRVLKDGYQEWKKELTLALANNPLVERVNLIPIPSSAEGDWEPSMGPRKWTPASSGWKFETSGALVRGDKLVLFDTESSRDFNTYRDFKLEFDVVFTNGKGAAWVARAKDSSNYYLFEISGPRSGRPMFNFYICQNGQLEWKDSRPIVEKIDQTGESLHIIFEARGDRFETRMTIASAPTANPHLVGIFQDSTFTYGGVGFRGKDLSECLLQTFFVIPIR